MNKYAFRQRCRPQGDWRIDQVIEFLELVKQALGCPTLYDRRSRPVEITPTGLRKRFEAGIDKLFPGIGVSLYLYTIPPRHRDDNTMAVEMHSGTHADEVFIDTYDISIGDKSRVPDFDYFEKAIEIFEPFEAYLSEAENEFRLGAYERQGADPTFTRPAIIRGFHYLDAGMARSIGAIDYCLKAPAWRARRFCQGVLIELVPGIFDTFSPEHVRIQEEVMDYFDML